ncbi:hypothetical protein PAECIP111891_03666 [Paenibacillus allorhizoplanae]|uniref:Uncharacterized protein n=2 Tax=Paenibacillus TaxID=44249 RepID=A0ABM9CDK3_9BACL|nr:hypothetical protein PAECIP111891_03666 [Paenibacillus allorhizoplanae]
MFTFWDGDKYALGVITKQGSLHVESTGESHGLDSTDIMAIIKEGVEAVSRLRQWVESLDNPRWLDESALKYGPCVTEPGKI